MKTLLPLVSWITVMLLPILALAEHETEYLPTPYTAEEIRDAWVEGFEVTTRTRSAAGETYSQTRVVAWTEKGFAIVDKELDAQGRERPGAGGTHYSGTWEELRLHARFPASSATREREVRETPLGQLEGWLYKVQGEEGLTEFFFADNLPGPPVVYSREGHGLDGFVAEQIERRVHPAAAD